MSDEKTHFDSIRFYLTGADSDGGAQTDPDASLGKYRSSTLVEFLSTSISNAISNITVDFVSGANGTGNGSLTASGNDELKWTPPSGSQSAGVTIANGETKIIEDSSDPEKFIRVTRTSADNLSGTATIALTSVYNNVFGLDNVSTSEASAGDTEYRCFCIKNDSANTVENVEIWIGTLGTQLVSGTTQLGASGAGTIELATGSFDDESWPDSGWCRIEQSNGTLREIVYYSSRTATVLTVPSGGRERLGTSAAAGGATDKIYPVPGIRIGSDAPASQSAGAFEDETAGEGTQPGDVADWTTGITEGNGLSIGDLSTGNIYGIWIEREIPASATAEADHYNYIQWSFDAA